jgi:hypothetical protein
MTTTKETEPATELDLEIRLQRLEASVYTLGRALFQLDRGKYPALDWLSRDVQAREAAMRGAR